MSEGDPPMPLPHTRAPRGSATSLLGRMIRRRSESTSSDHPLPAQPGSSPAGRRAHAADALMQQQQRRRQSVVAVTGDKYAMPCFLHWVDSRRPDLSNDVRFFVEASRLASIAPAVDSVPIAERERLLVRRYLVWGAPDEVSAPPRERRKALGERSNPAMDHTVITEMCACIMDAISELYVPFILEYPNFISWIGLHKPFKYKDKDKENQGMGIFPRWSRRTSTCNGTGSVPHSVDGAPQHRPSTAAIGSIVLGSEMAPGLDDFDRAAPVPLALGGHGSSSPSSPQLAPMRIYVDRPSTPKRDAAFGVRRGHCLVSRCDCEGYQCPTPQHATTVVSSGSIPASSTPAGGQCMNCGHFPTQHANLGRLSNSPGAGTTALGGQSAIIPVSAHSPSSPSPLASPVAGSPQQMPVVMPPPPPAQTEEQPPAAPLPVVDPLVAYAESLEDRGSPFPQRTPTAPVRAVGHDALAAAPSLVIQSPQPRAPSVPPLPIFSPTPAAGNGAGVNQLLSSAPEGDLCQPAAPPQVAQNQLRTAGSSPRPENACLLNQTATPAIVESSQWLLDPREITFEDEPLGSGKSASVHRGRWRNQDVAVKVLRDSIEQKTMDDFKQEVQFLCSLRSSHFVYFYGVVIEPRCYLVLEYCSHGSLNNYLQSDVNFTWETLLRFAQEATRGLSYLHNWRPQIVHRDFKSHNLLISESWAIKITDFGLCRSLGSNRETLAKVRGTYAYCCPELYYGNQYTDRSDVYSLSIVIWEMVTRCLLGEYQRPFSEFPRIQFEFQILLQVAKANIRPTLPSNCPAEISQLITDCWDSAPDQRPSAPNVLDRLAALEAIYRSKPKKWEKLREKTPKK